MEQRLEQFNVLEKKENRNEMEKKLIENLEFVIESLNYAEKDGLKYSVVGGVAMEAWLGEEHKPLRENGSRRDLDIIVVDDPQNKIPEIKKLIKEKGENDQFLLPSDFNMMKTEDCNSPLQLLSHFKKKNDEYYLTFRDIEKQISPDLMKTSQVNLKIKDKNVPIKSFEPGTLLHLYLTRMGSLKTKDINKLKGFLRENSSLKEIAVLPKEHKKYRVFHQFAGELKKKYPLYTSAVRFYNLIDHLFFNSVVSHKLIPKKFLRYLINL